MSVLNVSKTAKKLQIPWSKEHSAEKQKQQQPQQSVWSNKRSAQRLSLVVCRILRRGERFCENISDIFGRDVNERDRTANSFSRIRRRIIVGVRSRLRPTQPQTRREEEDNIWQMHNKHPTPLSLRRQHSQWIAALSTLLVSSNYLYNLSVGLCLQTV